MGTILRHILLREVTVTSIAAIRSAMAVRGVIASFDCLEGLQCQALQRQELSLATRCTLYDKFQLLNGALRYPSLPRPELRFSQGKAKGLAESGLVTADSATTRRPLAR